MSDSTDRPFGHETLKLRAVFVPEGAEDRVSRGELMAEVGHDAAKVAAVLVRPGGTPPGYPFEPIGQYEFRREAPQGPVQSGAGWQSAPPPPPAGAEPDEAMAAAPPMPALAQGGSGSAAARRVYTREPTPRPAEAVSGDEGVVPPLPRTRYRFGTALAGREPPGLPPNPCPADSAATTMQAAIRLWRSMAAAGRRKVARPADGTAAARPVEGDAAAPQPHGAAGNQ